MSETYRAVTTRFRSIAPSGKAVFVDRPANQPGGAKGEERGARPGSQEVSIPRSLIHGADDRTFEGLFAGEEVTFRLMDWKAEELGFA
jgi:hypothetical protein